MCLVFGAESDLLSRPLTSEGLNGGSNSGRCHIFLFTMNISNLGDIGSPNHLRFSSATSTRKSSFSAYEGTGTAILCRLLLTETKTKM